MTRPEVDIVIDWAANEGWNPGLHDAPSFFSADPGGFLLGLQGETPVAAISAVAYGSAFGFIGFYIVLPAYRGQGFGMQMWDAALAKLNGRTVGLDGVVAQQANYRRSGFALAYPNVRYQGAGATAAPADDAIVPLSQVPMAQVLTYDQQHFMAPRGAFLQSWLARPGTVGLGLVQQGRLCGYGVVRLARNGFKIGPLLADDPALAERLFVALRAQVAANAPLFLDTPSANADALALAQRHGLQAVFETARMYLGPPPRLPLQHWFGVTSFELG
jgi:GNAT superfamily N-acetyltransferase